MNYDPWWKTRGETALKVFPLRGIIAVELQPGQKKCELVYLPKSFFWGAIISMISLLVIFCLYFMPAKKRIYSPLRD